MFEAKVRHVPFSVVSSIREVGTMKQYIRNFIHMHATGIDRVYYYRIVYVLLSYINWSVSGPVALH